MDFAGFLTTVQHQFDLMARIAIGRATSGHVSPPVCLDKPIALAVLPVYLLGYKGAEGCRFRAPIPCMTLLINPLISLESCP